MTAAPAHLWPGPNTAEARALYQRAREAGMSAARSLVLGAIGSFRDCWAFRRTLAMFARSSVRTVQRAITQGKELGLIGVARAKKDEIPTGHDAPFTCGWSHRWVIGAGKAGAALDAAIAGARARWLVRQSLAKPEKAAAPAPVGSTMDPSAQAKSSLHEPRKHPRRYTAEELDAELARLPREGPDPPD